MLSWLLGIESADGVIASEARLEWLSAPSGDGALFLGLAVLFVCWLVWVFYRWEAIRVGRIGRLCLTSLRLAAIAAVIGLLCEPIVVLTKRIQVPSHVLVLWDQSESMNLRDAWPDADSANRVREALQLAPGSRLTEQTRADLVRRILRRGLVDQLAQGGDREVHVHSFAERMEPYATRLDLEDVPASRDPSDRTRAGHHTAIGSAIRQALMAYHGLPLAGIVLISDGQSNFGESPEVVAEFAEAQRVPIHVLAMGTQQGPRNASIVKIDSNPIAFIKDINDVGVVVQSRGMSDASAIIILECQRDDDGWREVGRQTVTLADDGSTRSIGFPFSDDTPGQVELRVRLEAPGEELTTEDNTALSQVRLIPQVLRVLFIAGSTFPEVQFIRNSLIRDPGVTLSTWNQAAEDDHDHPGDVPISRLPVNNEELDQYDCVVLYDPDPAKWPTNFSGMLDQFVSLSGGGLIYIVGEMQTERSFQSRSSPDMAWLALLPVVREEGLFRSDVRMQLSAQNAWRLLITPEGMRDHVFAFSNEPDENQRIVDSLPGMYWHFPVSRAKAGATVLARHGDPRMRNEYGAEVLLATHRVGPGRVDFVGFDSTYRWRYINEQTFDGFWARMVDRAGRSKQLGGGYPFRTHTDKLAYEPGDHVRLTASLIDSLSSDLDADAIAAEVEHGDAPPVPLTFQSSGRDGEFESSFVAETPGQYLIRAWAGQRGADANVKMLTRQIEVLMPNAEYEKPVLDRGRLEAIAATTGGQVFDLARYDQIARALSKGKVDKLLEDRIELWNAPLMVGVLVSLIVGEWLLRKRWDLV